MKILHNVYIHGLNLVYKNYKFILCNNITYIVYKVDGMIGCWCLVDKYDVELFNDIHDGNGVHNIIEDYANVLPYKKEIINYKGDL